MNKKNLLIFQSIRGDKSFSVEKLRKKLFVESDEELLQILLKYMKEVMMTI